LGASVTHTGALNGIKEKVLASDTHVRSIFSVAYKSQKLFIMAYKSLIMFLPEKG
jgi:hypothetical protein